MNIQDKIAPINPSFHRAVEAEIGRATRKGYTPEHDDQHGIDHLLSVAYDYLAQGSTVRAGFMIVAARGWVARNEQSNVMQRQIAEFMNRCDQEVALYPQLPSEEIVTLRIRLMVEELLGAIEVEKDWDQLDDVEKSRYLHHLVLNKSDELISSMIKGDLVGVADGIADVLYVVIGTAVAYGINIKEVFDEVHRSNLSKTVWSEELQRYTIEKDEYGKGIKPPTYSPADLETIVYRQIAEGRIQEYWEWHNGPNFDKEDKTLWNKLSDSEKSFVAGMIWDSTTPIDPSTIPDTHEVIEINVPDNA